MAGWVRRGVVVTTAVLAIIGTLMGSPSVSGAATVTSPTPRQMANAKLPSGVCFSSAFAITSSRPIQLSHGRFMPATFDGPNDISARIVGKPVHIRLAGAGHNGVAVVIGCNAGGSAVWTSLWVFDGSAYKLKVLFGGILPRSYDESAQSNLSAGQEISGISAKRRSLVVSEQFAARGDCVTCTTGRTTTTWGWSASNRGHLVITRPSPKKVTVVTRGTPSGFGGAQATRNQAGSAVVPGHTVLATCTVQSTLDGSLWTELDTGGWLPNADLAPVHLPDCDGGTVSPTIAPPSTSPTVSPITTITAPSASPFSLADLDTAAVTQSGLGSGTTANCGPAPTGLGVGAYVACSLTNPNVGGAEEVLQITGALPSSFNVVVGPGSEISCSALNPGEQTAFSAQGQAACSPSG